MPVGKLMLAGVLASGISSVKSIPINIVVNYHNSSGLSCHKIAVALVYSGPSNSSHTIGVIHNFIASTGPQVNGFIPMITGRGIRGWVAAEEAYPSHGRGGIGDCWVQQAPDGRLLFGWSKPS